MKVKINEIIKEAEYADIVLSLLSKPYQISSVTKIIFFAFCINHEDSLVSYRNRTKDFVDVFFENISLKLATDYKDIGKIVHVLDMLVKTQKINIIGDYIEIKEEIKHNFENSFIRMCANKTPNPVLELNKLDAKAVIEEVIRYV